MKFNKSIPVQTIAEWTGARLIGNKALELTGMNEINKVEKGDLIFVDSEKYYEKVLESAGSAILIDREVDCPEGKALLVTDSPFEAFNALAYKLNPVVHLHQSVAPDLICGENSTIEKGAIIAGNCRIGKDCHIHAGAYIGKDTVIGDRCNIQPGAIVGSDAFYFKKDDRGYTHWRSTGRVVIEDDVFIGSGSTINRGVTGDTCIGAGTKIDCLVQLGHGVVLGKQCLLAAQVGIGGETVVGDRVVMYGQVGVAQTLHIGDDAVILAQSGVSKNLPGAQTYFGSPATEVRQKYRELAALRNLQNR